MSLIRRLLFPPGVVPARRQVAEADLVEGRKACGVGADVTKAA
jgi:hypothetical protein